MLVRLNDLSVVTDAAGSDLFSARRLTCWCMTAVTTVVGRKLSRNRECDVPIHRAMASIAAVLWAAQIRSCAANDQI